MKIFSNSLKISAILICTVLFSVVTPPAESGELLEEVESLSGQRCSVEENMLLVHGQYHHPYPPYYHSPPPYHPSVYPPYYPYHAPYPASGICRNQLFFCYMNGVLPVGAPCICYTSFGVVWFSGKVTAY